MPNKTIYVKDSDLPLWDRAQAELGKSVSAVFADCLRRTLDARMTEERKMIVRVIVEIEKEQQEVKTNGGRRAVLQDFEEARQHAEEALARLGAGDKEGTVANFVRAQECLFTAKSRAAKFDSLTRQIKQILDGKSLPTAGVTIEGFLHVLRSDDAGQTLYAVSFAPIGRTGEAGAMQMHQCRGEQLLQFLQAIGVAETAIDNIVSRLKNSTSAHEIVSLPKDVAELF